MNRLYAFCCVLLLTNLSVYRGYSQISQGGEPMHVSELKSSVRKVIEMPVFAQWMMKDEVKNDDRKLKPFKFAHPFEVNLSTENSGEWYQTENSWRVWKLSIHSEGAKSLNLIFDKFNLPDNTRLFIYNENEVLGAFTSSNNKSTGKFAITPISGDIITVQYETKDNEKSGSPFVITTVNHDYVGLFEKSDRRPLEDRPGGIAGDCNIDVNCEIGQDWQDEKKSVCRIIVDGKEVCSGVLVNNTAEDQKPYILSAAHCYDKKEYAQTSVYVFNFESPYCAPLDGDPSHSVAGAVMKATFDSLDFALTELSVVPPPEFLPYYAGWDRNLALPSSSVSIHHPWGMIKKIAIDYDPSVISNFDSFSSYIKNGFIRILRWNSGVTEPGSSGGPLFNSNGLLIGTLTGGDAVCNNPVNDYFERFALSWDYKSDSTKQLKYWLDPINANVNTLDGKQFNSGETLCGAFTNLKETDDYSLISLLDNGSFSGYWGGSNSLGVTEIMERFSVPGNEQLAGVSLGVGLLETNGFNNQSEITIKVYNGNSKPEELIYSQPLRIKGLAVDAMNFIGFNEIVIPADTFFVGFELSGVQVADSFAVYQSLRYSYEKNNCWLKKNGEWHSFNNINPSGKSMSNIFELIACNIDDFSTDTPLVNNPKDILIYPNPVSNTFTIETGQSVQNNSISVFNLLGQELDVNVERVNSRKVRVDMSGNIPGVYLVRYKRNDGFITRKVSYVPW